MDKAGRQVFLTALDSGWILRHRGYECILTFYLIPRDFDRLVKWDMRTPGGVVQQLNSPTVTPVGGKDYARNTNFNCMATSGELLDFRLPSLLHCLLDLCSSDNDDGTQIALSSCVVFPMLLCLCWFTYDACFENAQRLIHNMQSLTVHRCLLALLTALLACRRRFCGCWLRRWHHPTVQRKVSDKGEHQHPRPGRPYHLCRCDI